MWDHGSMVNYLRKSISEKAKVKDKISVEHYRPDIFCEIDGKRVVFEIETYATPSKIIQDIIFSYIMKANMLVIIFSNKHGRGKVRENRAMDIKQELFQHFPELSHLKIRAFSANDFDNIDKIINDELSDAFEI